MELHRAFWYSYLLLRFIIDLVCGVAVENWNFNTTLKYPPDLPVPHIHSPAYLAQLTKYEAFAFDALTDLVESNFLYRLPQKVLEIVEAYRACYSQELFRISELSKESFQNDAALVIAQSPILAFNMLWRFVHELTLIFHLLQPYALVDDGLANVFISDFQGRERWPNKSSIEDAMLQILRLQLVYDIEATFIASGVILGTKTGAKLKLPQMIRLAEFAKKHKRYTQAIPWLELVVEILEKEPDQNKYHGVRVKSVEELLKATVLSHNLDRINQNGTEFNFYTELLELPNINKNRTAIRKLSHSEFRQSNGNIHLYQHFYHWSLCSGNNHQTEAEKQILTCWYDTATTPGLTIYPIKTELLSSKPRVIQIYDVLSDSEMEGFLDLSNLHLDSSTVIDEENPRYIPDVEARSSVDVHQFKILPRMNKFIEQITGLTFDPPFSSEKFRVASYAFGGHFQCHLDAFVESLVPSEHGNRLATMMFYFENTQLGGLTAFPEAGFAARPIKGSALFWYNLKRNGMRDRRTLHCACPVIFGRKTIATQWIRYHPQFRTHPCGLREDD